MPFPLQSTALILLDLQTYNLNQLANNRQLIANAVSLLSTCRQQGIPIAHVRVALDEQDYLRLSPYNKNFSFLMNKGSAKNAGVEASLPEMQFHPDVAPINGEIVVRKTRIGAFSTTNLHSELQQRKVHRLIIAGIGTSGAVLSTVRDAVDKDYAVTVVSDSCDDRKREVHDFLLEHILAKSCDIMTTAQTVEGLQQSSSSSS